jgi:hypothetical protein
VKLKTIVDMHLGRERVDVLLAVLVPLFLMVLSGFANGWAFSGGDLSPLNVNMYFALVRGFFVEGMVYAFFKVVRILFCTGQWKYRALALLPFAIGTLAMVVSSYLNIGWEDRSGSLDGVVKIAGDYMPGAVLMAFKVGVGLLFPIGLASCALLDMGMLVDDMFRAAAQTSYRAAKVEIAEMHRNEWLKQQRAGLNRMKDQYKQIAEADTQNMLNRVRQNDYSFGLDEFTNTQPLSGQPSVTRVLAPSQTIQLSPTQTTQLRPSVQGPYQAPPPPPQNGSYVQNGPYLPIQPIPRSF